MKNKRLTAQEAADIIGVRYQTLLLWNSRGTHAKVLPIHKTTSGRIYLMSRDVEKFAKDYSI